MKTKTTLIWWVGWGLWVAMFTIVGYKNLDPDFGWHVRAGEYVMQKGIAKTDPFSYTMPSYPFIDHEWLTNVVMYLVTEHYGYGALAVIFGLLAGGLWLLLVPKRGVLLALIPVLMGAGAWLVRAGVRPQILDWLFLAGLLRLVWQEKVWKKWRWWVVPGFGLWANLHGGYAIGPAVLGVIIVLKAWEKKQADRTDVAI